MKPQEIQAFSQCLSQHLHGHILPFWSGLALDHKQGGWMAWLSNDLKPDRAQPKGLVLNARILWTFAAACEAQGKANYREMADRALEVVMRRFWDQEHGGAFWQLDGDGRVLDDSKKIYGQAFCIYALAEYHRAFNAPLALAQALDLFELVERHGHDSQHGGYLEVRRRNWSEAGPAARLSSKDLNAKKSMNTNLHVLEAFTNLHRVWKEPRLAARLRELILVFRDHILDAQTYHFHHFFDESWNVCSDSYTFGHDIEGSWLLCEAAEELGDAALLSETRALAVRMAEVVLREGVDGDGGLWYEGGSGQIVDAGKEWWPQAEAVVGFINAYQLSREERFLQAARRSWDYIERHLVDRTHGDWFWRINPEGKLDPTLPKLSEWKCPYHSARACLEAVRRLNEVAG